MKRSYHSMNSMIASAILKNLDAEDELQERIPMVDTLEIIPTVKLRKKPQYHEFALQRTIWEYLSWRGVFCWIDYQPMTPKGKRSFQHHSSVGVSDILGSYQGRPLAIEVKVGTNKPTPKQLEFLERAKMAGWIAFVARSIEDVQRELKFKEV